MLSSAFGVMCSACSGSAGGGIWWPECGSAAAGAGEGGGVGMACPACGSCATAGKHGLPDSSAKIVTRFNSVTHAFYALSGITRTVTPGPILIWGALAESIMSMNIPGPIASEPHTRGSAITRVLTGRVVK
jgi:hypothetical protein